MTNILLSLMVLEFVLTCFLFSARAKRILVINQIAPSATLGELKTFLRHSFSTSSMTLFAVDKLLFFGLSISTCFILGWKPALGFFLLSIALSGSQLTIQRKIGVNRTQAAEIENSIFISIAEEENQRLKEFTQNLVRTYQNKEHSPNLGR